MIGVWIAMGFGRVFVVHRDQIIHGALVSASLCLYTMLNGLLRDLGFVSLLLEFVRLCSGVRCVDQDIFMQKVFASLEGLA